MMNTVNFYGVAFFLIYVILVALITLRNRSSASVNEYAIGNWNVGFWGTLASIVSGFRDGAGIAVWVTLAYFFGFGALWLTVGTIAGALLMFWATNRIKGKSETDSFITVGDLVKSKSGKILCFPAFCIGEHYVCGHGCTYVGRDAFDSIDSRYLFGGWRI